MRQFMPAINITVVVGRAGDGKTHFIKEEKKATTTISIHEVCMSGAVTWSESWIASIIHHWHIHG
jgi:predicted kinase